MTLDQVISLLRSNIKVDLIVIAGGTSGSSRHSYLNVQLRPKKREFLGMNIKLSSANSSVYISKIFRTGTVATDGQLRRGDTIIAVQSLDGAWF